MTDQVVIDEDCRICVLQDRRELHLATEFLRREELIAELKSMVAETLTKFGGADCAEHDCIANKFFTDMLEGGVFDFVDDQFAGEYFRYLPPGYQDFRSNELNNNVISSRARAIGSRYFPDAFARYIEAGGKKASPQENLQEMRFPAAGRLVSLDHNSAEYQFVRDELLALTTQISADNEVGETADERDRLVRSLESAQTLWRAAELQIVQIKVGVILAIEEALLALQRIGRSVTTSLLVDAIKALVKSKTGIDL